MIRTMQYSSEILENSSLAAGQAEFYDRFWHLEQIGLGPFHRVRGNLIRTAVQAYTRYENPRILDLGCGFGWLSVFLSHFGRYVGVDYSSKAISYAQCVFRDHGDFQVAEPSDLGLGLSLDSPFDVVVASEVIEHAQDHVAFVAQLDLFTRPDGIVVLTTPNGYLYGTFARKYFENRQPIENWITPPQLGSLLAQFGFEMILHKGIVYRRPTYGLRAYLISARLERLFAAAGRQALYERILLRNSIYQFAVARKLAVAK